MDIPLTVSFVPEDGGPVKERFPRLASKVAESLVFVRIKQGVPEEDNGDKV